MYELILIVLVGLLIWFFAPILFKETPNKKDEKAPGFAKSFFTSFFTSLFISWIVSKILNCGRKD